MKKAIFSMLCSIVLFSACERDRLTANGDMMTENRIPGEFTSVHTSGANRVKISYGNECKIVLKGSSNLIPYFKTTVINKQLNLSYKNANVRYDDLEIFVTLPVLKGASLSGSGNVDMTGDFPSTDELRLAISGSGDISLSDRLTVEHLYAGISGSGKMFLQKASAREADIDISGSGDVHLQVHDKLKARISGSGDIYYKGDPQLDSRISGSGKLIRY